MILHLKCSLEMKVLPAVTDQQIKNIRCSLISSKRSKDEIRSEEEEDSMEESEEHSSFLLFLFLFLYLALIFCGFFLMNLNINMIWWNCRDASGLDKFN